jgi:hypothetical protein
MANVANISGAHHTSTLSPADRCDITAPDHRKKEPAYAHSLISGSLGAMIATAAPACHAPRR